MVNCLVAHREVGKQFVNTIYLLLLNVLCNSCKAEVLSHLKKLLFFKLNTFIFIEHVLLSAV